MAQHPDHPWYAAFRAKDARFDGQFFVGISSTGIYCRPVCTARLPKAENCTFFTTAAQAEQAGYRPCLLCRPEQAPGRAPVDATASLARRAAELLEARCDDAHSLEALAGHLGCTARHLRRVFAAEYGVTPVQYLQTCRLLLAKGLLTDTDLPVTQVAMAAGFGSLRRFNALFAGRYRLSPTALHRRAASHPGQAGITLALGYRPPYRWQHMLDFLALRAIPGVEAVQDGQYVRTVSVDGLYGWLRVGHLPGRNALTVTVDAALLPALPRVLARVRRLFDLACDPAAVAVALAPMADILPGLPVAGTRLPGSWEPFEMAVRAVLGQQITVKGARTLAGRLAQALGRPLETGIPGLTHTFPTPEDILALEGPTAGHLGPLGITGARAGAIHALAEALADGRLDFSPGADPETQAERLVAIPGIGAWTAQYITMRAMAWPDAFPHTDYGVKKALAPRTQREILALAEAWRPWRAYGVINLWDAL